MLTYRTVVWSSQSLHSHKGRLDESHPASGLWRELRTWGSWFRPYWGRKPVNISREMDEITLIVSQIVCFYSAILIFVHHEMRIWETGVIM